MASPVQSQERPAPERLAGTRDGDAGTGLRRRLAVTLAAAAGPYGYTISLGGSISLATGLLGSPHLGGVLLLVLGAVVSFVALGAVAQGSLAAGALPAAPPTVWGNAHLLSAGLALCAVWGADHVLHGPAGWLSTGLVATGVYFVGSAVQQVVVARLRAR
jgi:hypothetical protein